MKTRCVLRTALALSLVSSIPISPAAVAEKFSDWCPRISLGPVVNSPFSDGGPAISKDGLSLYFHSNRSGNFDIYVSQRPSKHDPWGLPRNLGPPINTPLVETVPALSSDGHWLFFNGFNRPGGLGGFDIWVSYRQNVHDDFAWEPPINLGPGVNSTFNEVGASYFQSEEDDEGDEDGESEGRGGFGSADDGDSGVRLLYFGSNRPGGPGRNDIWVSAQQPGGSFGSATLVQELSSPTNEVRPSISPNGRELFLTRDVDPLIINDNDLWVSTRKKLSDPWKSPVKLGSTVNSDLDDIRAYIAPDRKTLYFESGPNEPNGNMDLYVTTRSKNGRCD
jgi:hypothetical protein